MCRLFHSSCAWHVTAAGGPLSGTVGKLCMPSHYLPLAPGFTLATLPSSPSAAPGRPAARSALLSGPAAAGSTAWAAGACPGRRARTRRPGCWWPMHSRRRRRGRVALPAAASQMGMCLPSSWRMRTADGWSVGASGFTTSWPCLWCVALDAGGPPPREGCSGQGRWDRLPCTVAYSEWPCRNQAAEPIVPRRATAAAHPARGWCWSTRLGAAPSPGGTSSSRWQMPAACPCSPLTGQALVRGQVQVALEADGICGPGCFVTALPAVHLPDALPCLPLVSLVHVASHSSSPGTSTLQA